MEHGRDAADGENGVMSFDPPQPAASAGNAIPTVPDLLAAELRTILVAEIVAGNAVDEVRCGWPVSEGVIVILAHPFRTPLRPATGNLRFRQVNLPGWWSAEYTTAQPPHTLACR
jgi:hypothetical protein